jgi:hypothetical protein
VSENEPCQFRCIYILGVNDIHERFGSRDRARAFCEEYIDNEHWTDRRPYEDQLRQKQNTRSGLL